jgi:hypothetical protein
MASVDAYLDKVQSFSPEELRAHLRRDYVEEGQEWPDYLDYVDEWKSRHRELVSRHRKDFIYHHLAKRHQKITCGDHYHQFSDTLDETFSTPNTTICITSPDAFIDVTQCWYLKLKYLEDQLGNTKDAQHAARLTLPEAELLKRHTALRLAQEAETPHLLDFDTFRKEWWDQSSVKKAMELYRNSYPPPIDQSDKQAFKDVISELKEDLPTQKAHWFKHESQTSDIILTAENVCDDHAFHMLLRSAHNFEEIINVISAIRSEVDPNQAIDKNYLSKAMYTCSKCRSNQESELPLPTMPGVFYSPPGNGKTQALSNSFLVAVDTDWTLRNSDFQTIIAPFLKLGLAVVTNQYSLATNSSEKFIGAYNPKHLRLNLEGKPYTSTTEILSAIEIMGPDLTIHFHDQGFLSDAMLALSRLQYIYLSTRRQFFNVKKEKYIPFDRPRMTYKEICSYLQSTASFVSKKNRANKARRKRHKDK